LTSPGDGDSLPVLACELSALTEEQRGRREALAHRLKGQIVDVEELPTGYAVYVPSNDDSGQLIEELVALERKCCAFLTFDSRIDPENDALVLSITGGPGVKAFVAEQFAFRGRLKPSEGP